MSPQLRAKVGFVGRIGKKHHKLALFRKVRSTKTEDQWIDAQDLELLRQTQQKSEALASHTTDHSKWGLCVPWGPSSMALRATKPSYAGLVPHG
jgi:hypothetical protein